MTNYRNPLFDDSFVEVEDENTPVVERSTYDPSYTEANGKRYLFSVSRVNTEYNPNPYITYSSRTIDCGFNLPPKEAIGIGDIIDKEKEFLGGHIGPLTPQLFKYFSENKEIFYRNFLSIEDIFQGLGYKFMETEKVFNTIKYQHKKNMKIEMDFLCRDENAYEEIVNNLLLTLKNTYKFITYLFYTQSLFEAFDTFIFKYKDVCRNTLKLDTFVFDDLICLLNEVKEIVMICEEQYDYMKRVYSERWKKNKVKLLPK